MRRAQGGGIARVARQRRTLPNCAPSLLGLPVPSGLHSHMWYAAVRQALFWSFFFLLAMRWSRMRVSRCFFDSCENISIVAEEMWQMTYCGGFLLDNRFDCSIRITNSQNIAFLREKISDVRRYASEVRTTMGGSTCSVVITATFGFLLGRLRCLRPGTFSRFYDMVNTVAGRSW